jgi:hypothetical protein
MNDTGNRIDVVSDDDVVTGSENSVLNTEVFGPEQRDQRAFSSVEKAYLQFDRAQRYADAEAELRIRTASAEAEQRLRHAEDLNTVNLQTLTAANVATTVADAALVNSLVGIIDKLTSPVPSASTGSSTGSK